MYIPGGDGGSTAMGAGSVADGFDGPGLLRVVLLSNDTTLEKAWQTRLIVGVSVTLCRCVGDMEEVGENTSYRGGGVFGRAFAAAT